MRPRWTSERTEKQKHITVHRAPQRSATAIDRPKGCTKFKTPGYDFGYNRLKKIKTFGYDFD